MLASRPGVRLGSFFGLVALIHVVGWGALLFAAHDHPALLGLGALAYTFGLRHAFDADHIAAIDNTTRKLLQDGQRPLGVGLFFSLGHSTVVLLIALALGAAVKWLVEGVISDSGVLRSAGALVGTSVSGVFLLAIGLLNLLVLVDLVRAYRHAHARGPGNTTLEHALAGGVMARAFGGWFRLIRASWQMYPIGFLFGLGFDTASEIALLAISAGAAANRLPFIAVVALPVIFAAGMTLMDTADGAFMSKAYSWAFSNPIRKLFYNVTITAISVFVALFVGLVELSQIAIQVFRLHGAVFDAVAGIELASLGVVIAVAFVVSWAAAFAWFKLRRVEERWAHYAPRHRVT